MRRLRAIADTRSSAFRRLFAARRRKLQHSPAPRSRDLKLESLESRLVMASIIGTVPRADGVLSAVGTPAIFAVDFDQPLNPATIGTDDLQLSQGTVLSANLVPDTNRVEYSIQATSEGDLNISIGAEAILDANGNPNAAYETRVNADISSASLAGFNTIAPPGSLVYQATANGSFQSQVPAFITAGLGGLSGSEKILFHNGDLYVASRYNARILRYDGTTGAPKPAPGQTEAIFAINGGLSDPIGIAFSSDGKLYVANYSTNSVLRFDSSGNALGTFISSGSGGLNGATGLTFGADGNLYVSSRNSDQVMRYNSSGSPLPSAGKSGAVFAQGGGLDGPDGLTFGPDGRLYVSSQFNHQVIAFSASGTAASTPYVSAGSGGLSQPLDLRFGPDGRLYVTSYSNSRVLRYQGVASSTPGAFVDTYVAQGQNGLNEPTGLTFGPDAALYVTHRDGSRVLRFDGTTGGSGDIDQFTFDVEAGQTVAVQTSFQQANVTLSHSVLGDLPLARLTEASAVQYQAVAIPVAGTITVTTQAASGSIAGGYNLQVTLGAQVDTGNGSQVQSQSLQLSTMDVDASANVLLRSAVTGRVHKTVARVLKETEGVTNDIRGSWDRVGSSTTWTVNNSGNSNTSLNKGIVGSLYRTGNTWNAKFDPSDAYYFEALAGDVITLRTRGGGSGGVPKAILQLRDPDGNTINGSPVAGSTSDYSINTYALTKSGSYTAIVTTDSGMKGSYTLLADLVTQSDPRPNTTDIYELQVDSSGYVSLAAATGTAPVTTAKLGVALYAPGVDPLTGAAVATSAVKGSLDSWLEYKATATGTYKVKVTTASGLSDRAANYTLASTVGGVLEQTAATSFSTAQDLTGRQQVLGGLANSASTFIAAGSGGLNRSIGIGFAPDGKLFVSSFNSDEVMRYNGTTGAPLGLNSNTSAVFITKGLGGLDNPEFLTFGPDGNLYVVSSTTDQVYRFNPNTGALIGPFLSGDNGVLQHPLAAVFGPDGNGDGNQDLYVTGADSSNVVRYDGVNGNFIDEFVPTFSGGLNRPEVLTFGGDGHLYVSSSNTHEVLRYDGTTGAFLGAFVTTGTAGLGFPTGLIFGPDGNLYVASVSSGQILRFSGATGAFMDVYASGVPRPTGLTFGPDGKLYVSTADSSTVLRVDPGSDYYKITVNAGQRLVAATSTPGDAAGAPHNNLDPKIEILDSSQVVVASGTLIDSRNEQASYVAPATGTYYIRVSADAMSSGSYLVSAVAASPLVAESTASPRRSSALTTDQLKLITAEARRRWTMLGADPVAVANTDVLIADLPGNLLGETADHQIWIDRDAAGWNWFVDASPQGDSEFYIPGNQGEQDRMDLLSVVMHEFGHRLGLDHDDEGVMAETLAAGTRSATMAQLAAIDALMAYSAEFTRFGKKGRLR